MLEIHIEYPSELYELQSYYPLATEKLETSRNMLSEYCSNIANECGMKTGEVNKLVSNVGSKTECVFHYKNPQLYLSFGMKLTKVHRILKFKQCD